MPSKNHHYDCIGALIKILVGKAAAAIELDWRCMIIICVIYWHLIGPNITTTPTGSSKAKNQSAPDGPSVHVPTYPRRLYGRQRFENQTGIHLFETSVSYIEGLIFCQRAVMSDYFTTTGARFSLNAYLLCWHP